MSLAAAKAKKATKAAFQIGKATKSLVDPPGGSSFAARARRLAGYTFRTNRWGTIRRLHGAKLAIQVPGAVASKPEQTARLFLSSHPELLGLDATQDKLVLARIRKRLTGGFYVQFKQTHSGVECLGAFVTITLDAKGRVNALFSRAFPVITASAVPKVKQTAARAAVATMGAVQGAPKLLFFERADKREVALAWSVTTKNTAGASWKHLVDASSGKMIASSPLRAPSPSIPMRVYDGTTRIRDNDPYWCNCCTTPPGQPGCSREFECGDCSCMDQDQADAWLLMDQVAGYWTSRFGRTSWDDAGGAMRTNILTSLPSGAIGEYDPATNQVTVDDDFVNMDTMAHEWQHAVLHDEVGHPQAGDPQAINEGLAYCFAITMDTADFSANQRNAADPWNGPCLTVGAQPRGYRDYCHEQPWTDTSQRYNGTLLLQSCYLSMGDVVPGTDAPPARCGIHDECPGYNDPAAGHNDTWCACTSDVAEECDGPEDADNWQCVKERNGVLVPYRGRKYGWAPYYLSMTNGELDVDSQLHHYPWPLVHAAIDYDISIGRPADYTTVTVDRATAAMGFYDGPAPVQQAGVSDDMFHTQHRPAFVQNIHPNTTSCTFDLLQPTCSNGVCADGLCTQHNWGAVFYRASAQSDGANPGDIYYNLTDDGWFYGPREPVLDANFDPVDAGSGITAVRDPHADGTKELALVYRNGTNDNIHYILADLTAGSLPAFTAEVPLPETHTDRTPMGINYNGSMYIIYKPSGSTTLKYVRHDATTPFTIQNASQIARSAEAPSAVVAAGLLWVFFRGAGTDESVHYITFNGSQWSTIGTLGTVEPNGAPRSKFRPESYFHQYCQPGTSPLYCTNRIVIATLHDQTLHTVSFNPRATGTPVHGIPTPGSLSSFVSLRQSFPCVSCTSPPAFTSYFLLGRELHLHYPSQFDQTLRVISKMGGG